MPLDTVHDWFAAIERDEIEVIEDNEWVYGPKKNDEGETALMVAVRKRKYVIIPILMSGAISLRNREGKTALMIAAELDDDNACSLLLESEADIYMDNGQTALHLAAEKDAYHAVRALTERLESIKDKSGRTALDLAVRCGHIRSVRALLAHGIWTRYGQLKEYLEIAKEGNYAELIEYLQGLVDEIPEKATDDMYLNRVMDPIEDAVSVVTSAANIYDLIPNAQKDIANSSSAETTSGGRCTGGVCTTKSEACPKASEKYFYLLIGGIIVVLVLSILVRMSQKTK